LECVYSFWTHHL